MEKDYDPAMRLIVALSESSARIAGDASQGRGSTAGTSNKDVEAVQPMLGISGISWAAADAVVCACGP